MIQALGSALGQLHSYRHTRRVLLVCLVVFALLIASLYREVLTGTSNADLYHGVLEASDKSAQREREQESSIEHAGNSTLGFHAIYYINMKNRFDRSDAAALQSYISGIDLEHYPAVEADMIDPVGMPPTHRPSVLKVGEKGCWRAHANVWAEMVSKKLPPVLIMESDATWDINVRPIMSNLNKHFVEFLRKIKSTPVHDPSWGPKASKHRPASQHVQRHDIPGDAPADSQTASPPPPSIDYSADDPWLSEHWDLLSLGQCFEHSRDKDINLIYKDPSVPEGKSFFGRPLGHERAILKSAGIVCTTAYAISHTGAAKLLMRSSLDLDNPVDLLIRRLTLSRDLVAYSVIPPVIAQWEYRNDVGMGERGAQSDINGGKHKDTPANAEMKGWDEVKKTGSVWTTKGSHGDVAFDKMALRVAWSEIMGNAELGKSWYDPEAKN